jgi:hypothetical protein
MPRIGTNADEDEITEAAAAGTSTFSGGSIRATRETSPTPVPDDLRTALAPHTSFGTNLFEVTALLAVDSECKSVKDDGNLLLLRDTIFEELKEAPRRWCHGLNVKDTGDLLLLRDWIFEELGHPYLWIIMLSVVEWVTLTNDKRTAWYDARIVVFQLDDRTSVFRLSCCRGCGGRVVGVAAAGRAAAWAFSGHDTAICVRVFSSVSHL